MVGIYLRGNEEALNFQESIGVEAAKSLGYKFKLFKDKDKSVKDINKEGLNSLIESVKDKKIKKVIISDITRIGKEGDYVKKIYEIFKENSVELIILNISLKITDYEEFINILDK